MNNNTEVQIFSDPRFGEIRTLMDDNNTTWFVGKDVANILGYERPDNAIRSHVDNEDKLMHQISASGQRREMIFINESGLYSLILSSKLPQAREFKRWVTSEVLPQIRKTGGYIPLNEGDDTNTIHSKAEEILKRTVEERDTLIARHEYLIAAHEVMISEQQALIEKQKPMALLGEAVSGCEDSILIRDLAKVLTQNGVAIGQNRLFCWLRNCGYLFKDETRPIQKWVEKGLFDVQEHVIRIRGVERYTITTRVTGKGQRYFISGFLTGKFNTKNDGIIN